MQVQAYWNWNNGEFLQNSLIPASSGGFLHGYGLFETLYFHDSLRLWDAHWKRLQESASTYGLTLNWDGSEVYQYALELIQRNALSEARVRLTLYAEDTNYTQKELNSGLHLSASPYKRVGKSYNLLPLSSLHERSFHLKAPLNNHKSSSYAHYQLIRRLALQAGADDALLHDEQGCVTETTTANLFFYHQGRWCTPPLNTVGLKGVQRSLILELMEELHLPCDQRNTPLSSLSPSSDSLPAAFLTNSLIGLQPICRIGSSVLPALPESYHHLYTYWRTREAEC